MSPTRRTRGLVIAALAAVAAWMVTISVLILTTPATGAATLDELATEATAALSSDPDAFGRLLAAPLDADFAAAYVERLGGPATVTVDGSHRVLVSAGEARFTMAVEEIDGRWYLSALPPV